MIRILLVEDFEPYRSFVTVLLADNIHFQIICEASDGLEALEKAKQLSPDLILMDIGLPKLNGLEAARRIRELLPMSKIVFLTQEADADVMREAFNLGAAGYIFKQRTRSDLLPGLAAIFQGERFVSAGLAGESVPAND
jgi:DNA-binding NarL/FixJ family response regulator